jgi:hypothetical protein
VSYFICADVIAQKLFTSKKRRDKSRLLNPSPPPIPTPISYLLSPIAVSSIRSSNGDGF